MYKMLVALLAIAITMTACNGNEPDANKDEVSGSNQQQVHSQPADSVNAKWSSLPEYDTIIQQIDNQDYEFREVTDNEGKRILLLVDPDGNEQYKSIFIKETNRLKIIKIDGEGEIFNRVLD